MAEKVFDDVTYFSKMVNYEVKYVICPPGCHKDASVIGRSLYSPKSLICAAGIVDGSIPKTGGLMALIRVSG